MLAFSLWTQILLPESFWFLKILKISGLVLFFYLNLKCENLLNPTGPLNLISDQLIRLRIWTSFVMTDKIYSLDQIKADKRGITNAGDLQYHHSPPGSTSAHCSVGFRRIKCGSWSELFTSTVLWQWTFFISLTSTFTLSAAAMATLSFLSSSSLSSSITPSLQNTQIRRHAVKRETLRLQIEQDKAQTKCML